MTTKWRFLVVASVGIFLIALASSIGPPKARGPIPIQNVTYVTISGIRLSSLFDNLPKDSHYQVLKKALDARRRNPPPCDRSSNNKFARVLQLLGLSTTIVHAQDSCQWGCCPVAGVQPEDDDCPPPCSGIWDPSTMPGDPQQGDAGAGDSCSNGCSGYCTMTTCECPSTVGEGDTGDTGD